jgi:hypothetical protein
MQYPILGPLDRSTRSHQPSSLRLPDAAFGWSRKLHRIRRQPSWRTTRLRQGSIWESKTRADKAFTPSSDREARRNLIRLIR